MYDIDKPVLLRQIGNNKWIFGLINLLKDPKNDIFVISHQDIPIGSYANRENNKCGNIWKHYVKRHNNIFYKVTEKYDLFHELLIKEESEVLDFEYQEALNYI